MVPALAMIFALFLGTATARSVHKRPPSRTKSSFMHHRHSTEEMRQDLREALAAALGNDHNVQQAHLQALRQKILPTWTSLPKNSAGNIAKPSLRFSVHRHFMQEHHLSIVGLEPAQFNTEHDEVVLLTEFAPQFVRDVLHEGAAESGYSLDDVVTMIAAIEQLLQGTTRNILDEAIQYDGLSKSVMLDEHEVIRVLELYASVWMLGEVHDASDDSETSPEDVHENWDDVLEFVEGQVETFKHSRRFAGADRKRGLVWTPFHQYFSMEDIESIAASMTMEFGKYWEGECSRIKNLLVDMDTRNTGRVALKDFYGAATMGEWRFSESKQYLRELGALDETSSWHGPQLILTNYIQGPSNCIISADHYRVCCSNECEYILDEIEEAIGGPLGDAEQILGIVNNITVSLDEPQDARVSRKMKNQLMEIALGNGGKIALHGRLFAQWLHYVFPRDCPFPHKAGTTVALTPDKYGEDHVASAHEMHTYIMEAEESSAKTMDIEEDGMSQWSHEEEHLSDHTRVSAKSYTTTLLLLLFAGAVGLAGMFGMGKGDSPSIKDRPRHAPYFKAHAV
jgi:hypothetical protein